MKLTKNKKRILMCTFPLLVMAFYSVPVFAAKCGGVETSLIICEDDEGGVWHILNLVLDIMSIGVGILGVVGILVAGIQYLTAKGNEDQTRKAKNRIFQIVIGLALYAVLFAVLEWLLPGGIISAQSDLAGTGTTTQIEEMEKRRADIAEQQRQEREAQRASSSSGSSGSGGSSDSSAGSEDKDSSTSKAQQISDLAWKIVSGKIDYEDVIKETGYYDYMDKNCSSIGGSPTACANGKKGYRTFCSGFTWNVIRYTGVDSKYPMKLTGKQMNYANSSSKWKNVTSKVNGKTSKLKAGDLLIKNGHTLLITQNSKGQLYAAQAAVDSHGPRKRKISSNTLLPDGAGNLSNYQVFRIVE